MTPHEFIIIFLCVKVKQEKKSFFLTRTVFSSLVSRAKLDGYEFSHLDRNILQIPTMFFFCNSDMYKCLGLRLPFHKSHFISSAKHLCHLSADTSPQSSGIFRLANTPWPTQISSCPRSLLPPAVARRLHDVISETVSGSSQHFFFPSLLFFPPGDHRELYVQ